MDCVWRNKIDPYVDAELPDALAAQMDAHLLTCASCAAEAVSRSRMKRSIRSAAVATYSPRPEFRLAIQKAIGTEKRSPRRFFLPRFVLAYAAVALVVVAIGFLLYRVQQPPVLAEIADLHAATLASANPIDVASSDRHTVKPWFAGKLPFTFNLPDFESTPYRLVGGRVTYLEQTRGAQLLFAYRQHQISAFIFLDRGELKSLESNFTERRELQFSIVTWSEAGLRYVVIGDTGYNEVRPLAELLRVAANH